MYGDQYLGYEFYKTHNVFGFLQKIPVVGTINDGRPKRIT